MGELQTGEEEDRQPKGRTVAAVMFLNTGKPPPNSFLLPFNNPLFSTADVNHRLFWKGSNQWVRGKDTHQIIWWLIGCESRAWWELSMSEKVCQGHKSIWIKGPKRKGKRSPAKFQVVDIPIFNSLSTINTVSCLCLVGVSSILLPDTLSSFVVWLTLTICPATAWPLTWGRSGKIPRRSLAPCSSMIDVFSPHSENNLLLFWSSRPHVGCFSSC